MMNEHVRNMSIIRAFFNGMRRYDVPANKANSVMKCLKFLCK